MSRGRWLALMVIVLLSGDALAQNKKPAGARDNKGSTSKLDSRTAAALKSQFAQLDTNRDGEIDPVEAATVLRGPQARPAFASPLDLSGKPPAIPDPRLPDVQLFQTFDTNRDQVISLAEMEGVLGKLTAQQKQQQQKLQQQLQHKLEQLQRQSRQLKEKDRQKARRKDQARRARRKSSRR